MKLFVYITSAVFALNAIFADDHGNSSGGLPEGGFSTFHVVAEDPYEYIDFLKANPAALKAGGGDAVGYCMTMTGHDYPGEMFIWNAYSSLDKALSDGFLITLTKHLNYSKACVNCFTQQYGNL